MADSLMAPFQGIPMESLILSPIVNVAEGQRRLCQTTLDFLEQVCFDDKGTVKTLDLSLQRPLDDGTGKISMVDQSMKVPMASLLTIPNFAMKTMDIEFTMEVKTVDKHEDSKSAKASISGGANYLFYHVSISGSVSTQSTNTRETDKSAKYDLKVHAEQLPPSEGMSKLLDILNSTIQPIEAGAAKK